MSRNTESTQPRYWLITSPRTASNMLVKILNLSEQGARPAYNGGYFFLPAAIQRATLLKRPMNTWSEEEWQKLETAHQECFNNLQDHISGASKENQIIFVKEHAILLNHPRFESEHSWGPDSVTGTPSVLTLRGVESPTRSSLNLTWLPDEFLKQWNPTFLIRHPALMLPSFFRICRNEVSDDFQHENKEPAPHETTMKWNRSLYDFYVNYFGSDSRWPIVLDADDVMTKPEVVRKYATVVGLDPNKLCFTWEKASEDGLKAMSDREKQMLSSLNASSKVDNSKVAGNIDIEKEAVKWRDEFGEAGGNKLEGWVKEALPHYEYLRSKRLTVE